MEHNLTSARNKIYKPKWALGRAARNPSFFYQKWQDFLEAFYVEIKRKQSLIKSVHLFELISEKIGVRLSNFNGGIVQCHNQ